MLHAFAQNPTGTAPCCPTGGSRAPRLARRASSTCAGGMVTHRPSGRRLLLRQRDAGAFGVSAAVWAGLAPGAQRRMAASSSRDGGYRTRNAVDVGRLGVRAGERLVCPAALARARRRLVADGPARPGTARSRMRRCAISAGMRRMPSRDGPTRGCRPRLEWEAASRPRRYRRDGRRMSGSGPAAPTVHIRAIGRSLAPSASTTASS